MAEQGVEPLNQSEVKSLMTNVTGYAVTDKGANVVVYRAPDGTVRGKATWSGGSESDEGKWSVRDDGALCTTWSKWRDGKQTCAQVYDTGDAIVFANVSGPGDDRTVPKSDIKDGNIENL